MAGKLVTAYKAVCQRCGLACIVEAKSRYRALGMLRRRGWDDEHGWFCPECLILAAEAMQDYFRREDERFMSYHTRAPRP